LYNPTGLYTYVPYAVTLSHTNCNVNTTGSRRCAHPYVLLHPYEYRPDDDHPDGRNM
jgi:hypothetical protein